jgi:hypothetical protein
LPALVKIAGGLQWPDNLSQLFCNAPIFNKFFLATKGEHDFYIDDKNCNVLDRRGEMRFVQRADGTKVHRDERMERKRAYVQQVLL